jgi:hypothetical protein
MGSGGLTHVGPSEQNSQSEFVGWVSEKPTNFQNIFQNLVWEGGLARFP